MLLPQTVFLHDLLFTRQDGSTLIHLASKCGHPEVALFFVKRGVPLQMPNRVSKCWQLFAFRY